MYKFHHELAIGRDGYYPLKNSAPLLARRAIKQRGARVRSTHPREVEAKLPSDSQ